MLECSGMERNKVKRLVRHTSVWHRTDATIETIGNTAKLRPPLAQNLQRTVLAFSTERLRRETQETPTGINDRKSDWLSHNLGSQRASALLQCRELYQSNHVQTT